MNKTAAFDVLAATYDTGFTQTGVGLAQRRQSRRWLQEFLSGRGPLSILEINCGTGEDALWLASQGHEVVATDNSPQMIERAIAKQSASTRDTLRFEVCAFDQLGQLFSNCRFDLVFSNFAGLNCLSPQALEALSAQLHSLLFPNGHVAAVIFGKYNWWESAYYLAKARPAKAFRRWRSGIENVALTGNVYQAVYYHSIKKFAGAFKDFDLVQQKPVGLFIPPSYLDGLMQKHPRLFRLLVSLEDKDKMRFGAHLANHSYLLLKKK